MKTKQNFALPTITTTYAGEAASGYIAAALLSANTLDKKLVTIMPNVKFKSVLQKLDVSGIVQDASCDFVTSGSVAISERILEPKELQVNLQLCKQEFVDSWEALQLGYSAFDSIPANFNDFLISYVGGKVAEATEQSIWQGANINGQFLGFETAFSASIAAGGANHAEIWIEVEKWDGSTITTIATSPIEQITEGATPNLYSWSVEKNAAVGDSFLSGAGSARRAVFTAWFLPAIFWWLARAWSSDPRLLLHLECAG